MAGLTCLTRTLLKNWGIQCRMPAALRLSRGTGTSRRPKGQSQSEEHTLVVWFVER